MAPAIPTVTGIENPHMYFVELTFHIFKKLMDTFIFILSIPYDLLHLLWKPVIRKIDRQAVPGSYFYKVAKVFTELLRVKRRNRPISDGLLGIGDHQIFVDAGNPSESFTTVTSPERIIERKHLWSRLQKFHAVPFKPFTERELAAAADFNRAAPVALNKSGLERTGYTTSYIFSILDHKTIDQNAMGSRGDLFRIDLIAGKIHDLFIFEMKDTRETFLPERL